MLKIGVIQKFLIFAIVFCFNAPSGFSLSQVSREKSDMRAMATAIEAYYIDNNVYPPMPENPDQFFPTSITSPIQYLSSIIKDPYKIRRKVPRNDVNYLSAYALRLLPFLAAVVVAFGIFHFLNRNDSDQRLLLRLKNLKSFSRFLLILFVLWCGLFIGIEFYLSDPYGRYSYWWVNRFEFVRYPDWQDTDMSYHYYMQDQRWFMLSVGPDGQLTLENPMSLFDHPSLQDAAAHAIFDPTNGTDSIGDIFRFKQ